MTPQDLDHMILNCFGDAEWHLSLWFPRITRSILRLPASISDDVIQTRLLALLTSGALETGSVDGSDFVPCVFDPSRGSCPDLYVRLPVPVSSFGPR